MLSSSTERLELTWPGRSWPRGPGLGSPDLFRSENFMPGNSTGRMDVKVPVRSGSHSEVSQYSSCVRAVVEHCPYFRFEINGSIIDPYLSLSYAIRIMYHIWGVRISHLTCLRQCWCRRFFFHMTWQVISVTLDVDPHFVSHPLPASQLQLPDHLQSAPICGRAAHVFFAFDHFAEVTVKL